MKALKIFSSIRCKANTKRDLFSTKPRIDPDGTPKSKCEHFEPFSIKFSDATPELFETSRDGNDKYVILVVVVNTTWHINVPHINCNLTPCQK